MFERIVSFIRKLYQTDGFIPLHSPVFCGNEKKYLDDCIDSTFVSSVGKYVDRFEKEIANFTGAKHAVAVVNGTQALFIALKLVGADAGMEIITQSLTFVATANAIAYTGCDSVFVDVDKDTLGLSPEALRSFLRKKGLKKGGRCINKETGKWILACVPMHTLGHPCRIEEIKEICDEYNLKLVEDAAESIGSYVGKIHTGLFGELGILSFNGNKTITTGGGGMILTNSKALAIRAKHLTTTAKTDHQWEFNHNEIGYNFRMPNINAAVGVAQLENITQILAEKRKIASIYSDFFSKLKIDFLVEPLNTTSNYWLNSIFLNDSKQRDSFLEYSNSREIMTRCLWKPMHLLPMYRKCQRDGLVNTEHICSRLVNLPSSTRSRNVIDVCS